jgi:Coenzyme PQQ synthesis protein D (PqqD)
MTKKMTLRAANHVHYTLIDGGAVLLDLKTGAYLALNEVATRVWELLLNGRGIDEIVRDLAREYDVAEHTLRCDCEHLISQATGRGLLESAP